MSETVLIIQEKALAKLLAIRDNEPDAAELGLVVSITGIQDQQFSYDMALMRTEDKAPEDIVEHHGGLPIIIPSESVDSLRGASLEMSRDLLNPGLVINNPNSPSPAILGDGTSPDLTGPVPVQVAQVIEHQINPSIASHGGFAELVAVEDATAYVRLGGGCQGCGMASVTLSQGIESTIVQMVPAIEKVIDVTDHASGDNPYYEASKK